MLANQLIRQYRILLGGICMTLALNSSCTADLGLGNLYFYKSDLGIDKWQSLTSLQEK